MEGKYTAIIVEPRKHLALEFVLNNFLENLSDEWNIIIYYGNKNEEYLQNIIDTKLKKYINRISTKNLNVDNLSINDYNNLMTNINFLNSIPTELFLIFQTDTMICKSSKDLINNYLQYDYVGAPFAEGEYINTVGNGGLSLRRKSKMIEIIKKCDHKHINEDIIFSFGCNNVTINKPSINNAKKFSIEQINSDKSFGVHKPWSYKHLGVNITNDQCENYNELVKLNEINKLIENYLNYKKIQKYRFAVYILILYICVMLLVIIK